MAETASYMIPKPGRIQLISEELKPLLRFAVQSEISLTKGSIRNLFDCLTNVLKFNFRIFPSQSEKKETFGSEEDVIESILDNKFQKKIGAKIKESNVKALVREYTYTSILYREYRCKAVHEAAGVHIDTRKFWKQNRPYFIKVSNPLFSGQGLMLEFPSNFLIQCLETLVECSEKAIIGKGLIPLPIWNSICDVDEFDFIDVDGVPEPEEIKFKID